MRADNMDFVFEYLPHEFEFDNETIEKLSDQIFESILKIKDVKEIDGISILDYHGKQPLMLDDNYLLVLITTDPKPSLFESGQKMVEELRRVISSPHQSNETTNNGGLDITESIETKNDKEKKNVDLKSDLRSRLDKIK